MTTYQKETNTCELKTATGGVRTKHLCSMPRSDGWLCGQDHPAVKHQLLATKTPTKIQK